MGIRPKLVEIREIERAQGPAAAERALVALLRAGEQSHLAFLFLARMLMKQDKFEDAIRAVTKARSLAPLEADSSIQLGLICLRSKDIDRAAEAFADAIKLDPYSTRALLGAAAVKMEVEQYQDATELCERVLSMDPSMEQAHEMLARLRLKLGEKDAAVGELKGIVARNPDNKKALRAYVRLMRAENRGDEVLEFLEADALTAPQDIGKTERLARVAASVGRADIAAQNYEKMAGAGSPRASDKVRYAMALIQSGELVKARVMIDQLGTQKVMKPVAAKLLGDVALKQGDAAGAVRAYQQACRVARVPMLDPIEGAKATDEEALAEMWRNHAQEEIQAALKQRRAAN
jgi:tetratricopeptide (TPR) repeat protein